MKVENNLVDNSDHNLQMLSVFASIIMYIKFFKVCSCKVSENMQYSIPTKYRIGPIYRKLQSDCKVPMFRIEMN